MKFSCGTGQFTLGFFHFILLLKKITSSGWILLKNITISNEKLYSYEKYYHRSRALLIDML